MHKHAVISECKQYRYYLHRYWPGLGEQVTENVLFIGVNPSTADAEIDDATVRKWIGFCSRWNKNRFVVANLFAYRATNVRTLAEIDDPLGPENDQYLRDEIKDASLIIPCWGARSKLPKALHPRIAVVNQMLKDSGKTVMCFGKTPHGDPYHPLMLGYSTQLEEYFSH